MFKNIVLASNNAGKLREFSAILAPFFVDLSPQSAFDIPETDEPHFTFVENALVKARHAARLSGLPALADDSGLCVEALAGAPGVYSARYAGEPKSDARNNQKLLDALADVDDRHAHYYCALVLLRHADDPEPLIVEGEWHGEILQTPRGSGGFGYDPLFLLPQLGRSAAELSDEIKNSLSHRALAVHKLLERLRMAV